MVLVSACLAGLNCKYNGGNNLNTEICNMVARGEAIPVCPEQLGGCPTPRPAAEIYGGTGAGVLEGKCRVITKEGVDVTQQFIKGAYEVLNIARLAGIKKAVFQPNSPSCGCGKIYDGSFSGRLIDGNGTTAELLSRNGVKVVCLGSL
ncbi:MAG: DUF523 domain-containing protein [Acetivibrionales bacterium]|jgi:uncharacterized protein YbbK (DUF523 family)